MPRDVAGRRVRRPRSSVVYLSGGSRSGPTIVLNETLRGKSMATQGWVVEPRDASCLMFSGDLLHGVLPDPVPRRGSRTFLLFFAMFFSVF